jgi:hypothetical protein
VFEVTRVDAVASRPRPDLIVAPVADEAVVSTPALEKVALPTAEEDIVAAPSFEDSPAVPRRDQAIVLKHNYIGTEHILLGLLREEEGLAARVLESLDITVERVRAEVVRIVGSGEEVTSGQIPFTPRTKKVLELALREALNLGYDYIGSEHILLGLVRENEGLAARILLDFDADSEKIRNEVIRALYRQSNPEGAEDPDEQDLRRYFERRAEDGVSRPSTRGTRTGLPVSGLGGLVAPAPWPACARTSNGGPRTCLPSGSARVVCSWWKR